MQALARIVLADDHALVREGIRGLLEAKMPEIQVVAEAATGVETLKACQQHQPELLLLDISMPDLNGLDVLAEMKTASPATRALIISQHDDRAYVMRALQLGAKAYLPKKVMGRDVVAALRAVMAGRTWLDPSVADVVVEAAVHPGEGGASDELAGLTTREREILGLVAEGRTAPEIGKLLGISLHTANRHRANLMEKLGMHGKAELVRLAVRAGLLKA
jgi:DNA-binding NarL/FixJ family response regulator